MSAAAVRTLECEVLVVGGGAAACMAAISARDEGARVLVVDKGQLGKSGCSPNAHGGMAMYPKQPGDSWRVHLEDTLLGGGFLNDQELVRIMCRQAPRFIGRLEAFGSLFDRDPDGSYSVRKFGGHRHARSVFSGDETGHEMMIGLRRAVLRRAIPVLDEVMATRLLTGDGGVAGAFCWSLADGGFYEVRAPSVVLATADAAGIWPSASERQRGDGFVLALEAGAELLDMEFIQYHPTHAWWPFGVRGSVSESFRSEGGHLLNAAGERFMARYDPEKMELATRDRVSVAITEEIRAGRGAPHGGIFASVAHLPPEQIERRLPVIFRKYLSYGYDIRKEPIEVRPRPHYHCGGVRITPAGASTVPGLFAAGAVTAGVHGANRLGTNALVDILVFGEIAGRSAARRALSLGGPGPGNPAQAAAEARRMEALAARPPEGGLPVAPLRRRHMELMDQHMGVIRNAAGMRAMLEEVQRARADDLPRLAIRDKARRYNYELRDALEMAFRLAVEEMATRAALLRAESRGCHYREDFPRRNDREWLKNIGFVKADGALKAFTRDVATSVVRLEDVPGYARSDSPWH